MDHSQPGALPYVRDASAGEVIKKPPMNQDQNTQRARNLRTALILGSIALFFFVGVIIKHMYFR